jgi:arginyl-tRNA synthetase
MDIKLALERDIERIITDNIKIENGSNYNLLLEETRKDFEGDFTLVVFPLVNVFKMKPEEIGQNIGNWLLEKSIFFKSFNVVKGFLNLSIKDEFWVQFLQDFSDFNTYLFFPNTGKTVMVEYSSPNTNKPLHLGHVRNMLLGNSISNILRTTGNHVVRTQIVNDRGIAICKSMVAWKLFGQNSTPESTSIKGDHFVGKYYVLFETKFQEEFVLWQTTNDALSLLQSQNEPDSKLFFKQFKNEYFNKYSSLGKQAKEMLLKWEQNDPATIDLWKSMNEWVYSGFEKTYKDYGILFDSNYYESNTYLLGKEIIDEGLEKEYFYRKPDGSVWVDLESVGLDHKVLLRSDGTSVYITQDIGTAELRYKDYQPNSMIYVVADEQNYHFQVLFEILKLMKVPYADGLHHLSYGMVELPEGRMKSREGTVVDADDLLQEVITEAKNLSEDRGELDLLTEPLKNETIKTIGIGALKYFMLKVQPKKKMVFDPKESVDMQGNTGPYIQNAYVRILSIKRKMPEILSSYESNNIILNHAERELIKSLSQYRKSIVKAASDLDPSEIASYCYSLAKSFHRFYHECPILSADTINTQHFRIHLASLTANTLQHGMSLLGIDMPEKM